MGGSRIGWAVRGCILGAGLTGRTVLGQGSQGMADVIEATVEGLGCAFVEAVWAGGGLLRVTIDRAPSDGPVTVEDCERVTRQLQYVLEVEGVDYQRLEVSSPGLDRLIRKPEDFVRFAGQAVDVTLRAPFQGRKKYRGILQAPTQAANDVTPPGYAIQWDASLLAELAVSRPGAPKPRPGKVGAGKPAKPEDVPQELRFTMAEVREVRLVPVLDFRGRKS